jgi:hypothetical protein
MAFDPLKEGATEVFDPIAEGAVAVDEFNPFAEGATERQGIASRPGVPIPDPDLEPSVIPPGTDLSTLSDDELFELNRQLSEKIKPTLFAERPDITPEAQKTAQEAKLAEQREIVAQQDQTISQEIKDSLKRGGLNVVAGVGGTVAEVAKLSDEQGLSLPGLNQLGEIGGNIARNALIELKDPELTASSLKGMSIKQKTATFIAQVVPETLAFMAGTTAATVLGGPAAGALFAFSVEGDSSARDVLERGGTQEEANVNRLVVGTINAALEQLQVNRVLKFGEGGVEAIARIAKEKTLKSIAAAGKDVTLAGIKQFITEGLQEATQEAVSIATPGITSGEVTDIDSALQLAIDSGGRVALAGLAGGTAGLFLGGGAAGTQILAQSFAEKTDADTDIADGEFGAEPTADITEKHADAVPVKAEEAPPVVEEAEVAKGLEAKQEATEKLEVKKPKPAKIEPITKPKAPVVEQKAKVADTKIPTKPVVATKKSVKPDVTESVTAESVQKQPKVAPESSVSQETSTSVEDAVKVDVTDPAFPTSTKHASTKEIRERLGIGQVNSKTRRSDEQAMKEAVDQKIPEKAQRIADEINVNARALSDVEDAGMRIAVAELEIEHEQLMDLIGESTDDADIKTLSAEASRVEQEFDNLLNALETSGSEAGRALRARKVQVGRDFKLTSVLNRAKAAAGKKLSAAKKAVFKGLTKRLVKAEKKIVTLETEVQDLKAKGIFRRGAKRFTTLSKQQRRSTIAELSSNVNVLLSQGCNN